MRLIDGDALVDAMTGACNIFDAHGADTTLARTLITIADKAPTIGGWISVKDRLPEEHPSVFANYYGTEKWNKAMWRKESDRVLVAIRFPDGTRTDKGKLQDGVWKTGVSPVLPQEVTHWAMWPEPPKGE